MKTAAKRTTLILWLAIAVVQLLFSPQVASAKSSLGRENRSWEIFSLAAQSHQTNRLQLAEAQRERAPPQRSTAPGCVLGPETNAFVPENVFAYNPGATGFVIQHDEPFVTGNEAAVAQGDLSAVVSDPGRMLPADTGVTDLIVHPFADGATHITTTAQLDRYVTSPTFGGPTGLFVAPTAQIDELLASGASRDNIEVALGLQPGALSSR